MMRSVCVGIERMLELRRYLISIVVQIVGKCQSLMESDCRMLRTYMYSTWLINGS